MKEPIVVKPPVQPAKTPELPGPWMGGRLRGTRASVLEKIGASGLSAAHKSAIAEGIADIPPEVDLVQVDFHKHPHKLGANWTCTVTDL